MPKMSVKEALAAVLLNLERMSPEELRRELDANRHGDIAVTLREVRAYLMEHFAVFHYEFEHIEQLLSSSSSLDARKLSIDELMDWSQAANCDRYALAA